jgi:hypothetical protein
VKALEIGDVLDGYRIGLETATQDAARRAAAAGVTRGDR